MKAPKCRSRGWKARHRRRRSRTGAAGRKKLKVENGRLKVMVSFKRHFRLSAFISKHAVGASIARPAFGTNAICRRQIQPGFDNGPGQIALPGDRLLRKRGRAMLVPTHVEPRTLLRGARCAPLRGSRTAGCRPYRRVRTGKRGRQGAVPTGECGRGSADGRVPSLRDNSCVKPITRMAIYTHAFSILNFQFVLVAI